MNQTYAFAIAGVLLVCCGLLIYYRVKARELLDEMWAVKTYTAAELRRLCEGDFFLALGVFRARRPRPAAGDVAGAGPTLL